MRNRAVMAVLAVGCLILPISGARATACTFDAGTGIVSASYDPNTDAIEVLKVDNTAIYFDGAQCGTATTANTNSIVITRTASGGTFTEDSVTIDISGGPFINQDGTEIPITVTEAPGVTGNAVEFDIVGSSSADDIEMGLLDGGAAGVDLTGDGDVDVTITSPDTFFLITVALGDGNDTFGAGGTSPAFSGAIGHQVFVNGGGGDDVLTGGNGGDGFVGNFGADTMFGGNGFDFFNESSDDTSPDVLEGGDDSDEVFYGRGNADITVTLDGLANDGEAGENDSANVEDVSTDRGDDVVTGDDNDNRFRLGRGNDVGTGGGGNDEFSEENEANGSDVLDGGPGTDGVDYNFRTLDVTVTLDGAANDGEAGENDNAIVENVTTGDGNDTVVGDDGPNIIRLRDGNDVATGGAGDDEFDESDDPSGSDLLDGQDGSDSVSYFRQNDLSVTLDGLANDGEAAENDNAIVENVTAGFGNDTVVGNGEKNIVDLFFGDDQANLVDGRKDIVDCGNGNDTVTVDRSKKKKKRDKIKRDTCETVIAGKP